MKITAFVDWGGLAGAVSVQEATHGPWHESTRGPERAGSHAEADMEHEEERDGAVDLGFRAGGRGTDRSDRQFLV